MHDTVVIGGSLAGASCALRLARAGRDVVVVERQAFPRAKPCGEGLLPGGVAILRELGLGSALDDAPRFVGIRYHAHGVVADGTFSGEPGRGVRRDRLDHALLSAARDAGATVVAGSAEHVRVSDDEVLVEGGGFPSLRARTLVAADGPRSRVRHLLGLERPPVRAGRFALVRHFELAPGRALPDRVHVYACEGFELYLTPVGNSRVGLAALVEQATLARLPSGAAAKHAALLERCPAAAALLSGAAGGEVLTCGPLRVRARAVHRGAAVLIGDAAGYVDAITGEGMSLALHTAGLAHQAVEGILEGAAPARAFKRYARARSGLFRDHALLTHGLVFIARRPWLARRVVARLAREPALFTRLLEVNTAQRSFASLGPWALAKLAFGARPRGTKRRLPPIAST